MRRASLAQWFTEDREARLKAILRQAMTCELVMILTMYYEQGMTDQQIAKSLHCSREHVNKARNRFINDLH